MYKRQVVDLSALELAKTVRAAGLLRVTATEHAPAPIVRKAAGVPGVDATDTHTKAVCFVRDDGLDVP